MVTRIMILLVLFCSVSFAEVDTTMEQARIIAWTMAAVLRVQQWCRDNAEPVEPAAVEPPKAVRRQILRRRRPTRRVRRMYAPSAALLSFKERRAVTRRRVERKEPIPEVGTNDWRSVERARSNRSKRRKPIPE